jgi:hypothetical protein
MYTSSDRERAQAGIPMLGATEAQEVKIMAFPVIEVEPKNLFRLASKLTRCGDWAPHCPNL